jgi:adenosylhomocysteine nucleosidase
MINKLFLPVFALEEEVSFLKKKYRSNEHAKRTRSPIVTGLGKINAAIGLIGALESHLEIYPSAVVNLGTAGSKNLPKGTIVQCTSFLQRDMLVPGYPQGLTPFEANNQTNNLIHFDVENVLSAASVCSTGDSFATTMEENLVYDMEAYALAKVCKKWNLPFYCFKYITDDGGIDDWSALLKDASKKLGNFYLDFLGR